MGCPVVMERAGGGVFSASCAGSVDTNRPFELFHWPPAAGFGETTLGRTTLGKTASDCFHPVAMARADGGALSANGLGSADPNPSFEPFCGLLAARFGETILGKVGRTTPDALAAVERALDWAPLAVAVSGPSVWPLALRINPLAIEGSFALPAVSRGLVNEPKIPAVWLGAE